jgi:co-chaperonin GroES (HSP10)
MTVIPLDDRILVRPAEPLKEGGHTSAASPGDRADRLIRGTVIAAGTGPRDGMSRATPPVQAGDIILFARDVGREVTFGGMQYWMLKASDVRNIEVRAVTVELYGAEHRLVRSSRG